MINASLTSSGHNVSIPLGPRDRRARTLEEVIQTEGIPVSYLANFSGTLSNGAINTSLGSIIPPINRALWVDGIFVGSNVAVDMQVVMAPGNVLGTIANALRMSLPANGSQAARVGKLLQQTVSHSSNPGWLVTTAARRLRNSDGTDAASPNTACQISVTVDGFLIYDDTNFGADKIISYWGDSVFNGTGRTTKLKMYDWKIRQYYSETAGQNVRGTMKAVSGSTSSQHETWRQFGWHDDAQVDLLVYQLMINDAGQAVPAATYAANLTAAINMKKRRWPTAKMLVLGCHPLENAADEAQAALLRTQAETTVGSLNDGTLYYCNLGALGSAFSSVAANYASSDTAGSRVHPSDQGDDYIWNGNGSFAGLKAYLDANIPRI